MNKPYAFSKAMRCRGHGVVKRVIYKGQRASTQSWQVAFITASPLESQRQLAVIVPKRNVKLAVHRHRLKRLVREWFRQKTDLAIGQYAFLAKRGIRHDIAYAALRAELNQIVRRLSSAL